MATTVRPQGDFTVFPLAAQTADQSSSDTANAGDDYQNIAYRGITVILDVTAQSGGSVLVTIQGEDDTSGKFFTVLAGTARTTVGTDVLTVYPGITLVANKAADGPLPGKWRVTTTTANGSSITYSVGATLLI